MVVEPAIREVFSSSCDIGGRLSESQGDFPHFEFDRIDDVDAWYIHSIRNQSVREQLQHQLSLSEGDRNQCAR